jgi:hypothetical protein
VTRGVHDKVCFDALRESGVLVPPPEVVLSDHDKLGDWSGPKFGPKVGMFHHCSNHVAYAVSSRQLKSGANKLESLRRRGNDVFLDSPNHEGSTYATGHE